MPKVPTYQPNQISQAAEPGVMQNLRVDPRALGGDTRPFEAAQRMGAVAQKMIEDADDINVRDADLAAAQLQNRIEREVKEMRGKNSVGSPDYIEKEWKKGLEEIERTLSSDRQRTKFGSIKQARFISLEDVAHKHMNAEMRRHDDEQTVAYVNTSRDDALSNYKDPERIGISLMQQEKAILDHADRHGVSDEVRKQNVAEAISKTHYGVISRYVNNGEDLSATKYFKSIVDKLTGVDKMAAEKMLEEGSLRGEAQRQSDAIFSKQSENMTEALDKAREIKDPKLRDEVVSRVKQRFAEKKQAEQVDVEGLHRRATDVLDKTPDVDLIPREDWSRFSLSERAALKRYAADRAAGKQPQTDWQTYYDLMNMASGPKGLQDKFASINLMDMKYRGNLDDSEFRKMVQKQADIRSGRGQSDKELNGYRSTTEIVNTALNSVGIKPNPKAGSKDAERVAEFRRSVDTAIMQRQEELGKKLTNDEIDGIVGRLLVQGRVKGTGIFGLFQTKKRLYEVNPGETIVFGSDDIPMSERRRIEQALRANGRPVTESNIIELYKAQSVQDKGF